jgi:hypothetical protein
MLSLTASSQVGTDTTIRTKSFPIPVVKLIVKDLLIGDSAKALLKVTEQQLVLTEQKVILKDSIISKMTEKENNYVGIINLKDKKYDVLYGHTIQVEKDLKKEKVKNRFNNAILISVIGILTFNLITK